MTIYFFSGDMFLNIIISRRIKYLEVYLSASGRLYSLFQVGQEPQMLGLGETKRLHLSAGKLNHSTAFIILSLLSEKV